MDEMQQQAARELAARARKSKSDNPLDTFWEMALVIELSPTMREFLETLILSAFYHGISEGIDRAGHSMKGAYGQVPRTN
jgi:hypothetical protein